MDEQAKITLYRQLAQFEVMSKVKGQKLIKWEKFLALDSKDAFEYVLDYRDRCTEAFNKNVPKSERRVLYLELPEINLEGQDLSKFYLHNFMPGYSKETNNGKKVFVTTRVNLKDTNCIINMATIRPIIISLDGKTIKEISADVTKCDFRGCMLFGKFQNSKAKLEYTAENLPNEYINRLLEFKVPAEATLTTDIVYIDMLEGKIVRGTNGLDKVKQMVDYDMTNIKEGIWKYRTVIRDYKIDISYTGAFIYQFGMDSIGKENYYIDLDKRARDEYMKGNMEFVEKVFKELDKETKQKLVGLALKDGREKFAKKHQKELKGVQKKYLEAKDTLGKTIEAHKKIKIDLIEEYRAGKFVELEIDMMKSDIQIRSEVVRQIYNEGDMDFVQKYLTSITPKLKNEILVNEFKKGNLKFVHRNFAQIDNGTLKQTILRKEVEVGNLEFLYKHYEAIYNKELKDRIIARAYEDGNVEFLNNHLNDIPKKMKLEAAIKFKNLKLSKDELAELLKK